MGSPARAADEPRARGRRDPEARKAAIARAAADLLAEGGDLTHRRVADRAGVPLGATTYYFTDLDELRASGLGVLAARIDEALDATRAKLATAEGDPAAVAAIVHEYLGDRGVVRADTALYTAAVTRPELRPLALRWFQGMTGMASEWAGPRAATALAVFLDGAVVHASLHDEPLGLAELAEAVAALLAIAPACGGPGGG